VGPGWVESSRFGTKAEGLESGDVPTSATGAQPAYLVDSPMVRQALDAFLQTPGGITAEDVEHRPKQCRNTFFGIFTTLDRRQRMTFDEGAVEVVCSEISEKMGLEEKAAARTRAC